MDEMSSKERLLSAMKGQSVDRTPWAPFLAYYWDFLDEEIKRKGMVEYYKALGADALLRGTASLNENIFNSCKIAESERGNKRQKVYETPVGSITEEYTFSEKAKSWFLTTHPVKSEEDFKVLQYIFEKLKITNASESFEKQYVELGDTALVVPTVGVGTKTAFQSLVEHWCGTQELTYALCDYPEIVEECLDVMRERDRETVAIAAGSSAEAVIFWEDSSTTNISPSMFSKYTLPQINEWGDLLHKSGKLLIHHACGHLKDLVELIGSSKIDVLESISPPPTGNISLKEARAILPERIGILGGIEPVFLQDSTVDELILHVQGILEDMKGSRYILANSDSCPPTVEEKKFKEISKILRSI